MEELAGKTPIEWLFEKLKEEGYNPVEYVDPYTKELEFLFLAHPEAVKLYKEHLDILPTDCTYKTNRFWMPLLNICFVTGSKETVQVGLAFLSGEKEPDYARAIAAFRGFMAKDNIPEPGCIVTDRELELVNSINELFPESGHILCTGMLI